MTNLLTNDDLKYTYSPDKPANALVWVIGEDCVYDIAVPVEYGKIFLEADAAVDISADHPEHDGVVVRLSKQGTTTMELATTKDFGNILLSNPKVLDLTRYPYGQYVMSPDAKFDGKKFIILNRPDSDMLKPWPTVAG